MKEPRTRQDLTRWLQAAFGQLDSNCRYADYYDQLEIQELVEQAGRYACRFGVPGNLIAGECPTPLEALAYLGRLLQWAQTPAAYFDSQAASDYLGITAASLYALVERNRLKPLRGPRRTYRFTQAQLDEYLATNT